MRNRLKAKKQLLGGFVGNAGFPAKADLGLFRASAEIRPGNRPELQTHVKIRAVFLQNHPELQGRGKSRANTALTAQNSKSGGNAIEICCLRLEAAWASHREAARWKRKRHRSEAESPQTNAQS